MLTGCDRVTRRDNCGNVADLLNNWLRHSAYTAGLILLGRDLRRNYEVLRARLDSPPNRAIAGGYSGTASVDPETFPSVRSSALPTKDQSATFLAEALDFFRTVRCT